MLCTREEIWDLYRISRSTLLIWEKKGILKRVLRLPGPQGHRRFYKSEIEQVLGMTTEAACE